MMISTNMALIISAFPPEERGKVIGLNVTSVYVGSSVAPVIGGLLTDALGWRSIFYINGIAALCIAWLIIWKIPKEMPNPIKERFDFKGSLIYMLSISALMYGFSKLPSPHAIALTIAGVLGLLLFMRTQLKTETPMLNMRLFSQNIIQSLE
jgi:MFS family permease